jgi:hypothetical protein
LTLPYDTVFGQAGHQRDCTPQAGHEHDYLGINSRPGGCPNIDGNQAYDSDGLM